MQSSPSRELFNQFYHSRPFLIKWLSIISIITGFVMMLQFLVFAHKIDLPGLILFIFSFFPLGLYYSHRISASINCLSIGLTIFVLAQGIYSKNTVSFLFITLILITSVIFSRIIIVNAIFSVTIVTIIIALAVGYIPWNPMSDLEQGYYNNGSILTMITLITLTYILSIIIYKTLLKTIRGQHGQLMQLIQQEKLSSISVLASGIAHDYNNLLTTLLGNLNLIRMNPEDIENNELYFTEAEDAITRAKKLTDQLATLAGSEIPVKKVLALGPMLKELTNVCLIGSRVKAEFHISLDLFSVIADQTQLNLVFQNLILNAIQAMPKGGTLKISAINSAVSKEDPWNLEPGNYVAVRIIDQGIGIPSENLKKLFSPYFTTKSLGRGLGLAVSQAIVKGLGGIIAVESQVGKGSEFSVFLPASTIPAMIKGLGKVDIELKTGKVLLLDNEESVIKVLKAHLELLGFQIDHVHIGDEAIKAFTEASIPYDFAILDLGSNDNLEGIEVARNILDRIPNAILIASSDRSADILDNYPDHGFKGFLKKPYTMQDLADTLNITNNPSAL